MINHELEHSELIKSLAEIWEPKKEYIEKDLWVIRNFLTEEELVWLNKLANDPKDWYPTMRSPYGKNIRNKFIAYIPVYGEDGILIPPHPKNNPQWDHEDSMKIKNIENRIEAVVPKEFSGAGAFQSFFEVPEDEPLAFIPNLKVKDIDWAMDWHYERDDSDTEEIQRIIVDSDDPEKKILSESKISASFNVYINDNFNGGILEFKNKDYVIKPEPGMLVNIPLYKEFEHRITKVTNGNRHTLYGRSWVNFDQRFVSSRDDC